MGSSVEYHTQPTGVTKLNSTIVVDASIRRIPLSQINEDDMTVSNQLKLLTGEGYHLDWQLVSVYGLGLFGYFNPRLNVLALQTETDSAIVCGELNKNLIQKERCPIMIIK